MRMSNAVINWDEVFVMIERGMEMGALQDEIQAVCLIT